MIWWLLVKKYAEFSVYLGCKQIYIWVKRQKIQGLVQIPFDEHPFFPYIINSRLFVYNDVLFPWNINCYLVIVIFVSPLPYPKSLIMSVHRVWDFHFFSTRYSSSFVAHELYMFVFFVLKPLKQQELLWNPRHLWTSLSHKGAILCLQLNCHERLFDPQLKQLYRLLG